MAAEVIARETELSIVRAFLDRPNSPHALVLEGEAGIGKSTLWSAGVALARLRFPHVLASRPAESERTLANVVLGDLFGEVTADLLAALPRPRRRAFENALLLGEVEDAAVDPRALAAAILTIVTSFAAEGPLLIAIDDEQWVDASSAASLGFVLRRLRREPILLLLARRVDGGSVDGTSLERALAEATAPGAVERVRVGPLSIGALQLLLQNRLGVTLSRPNLLRLGEASGGNAFFALELARAQPPPSSAPAPLVVPPNLESLLAGRLDRLDEDSRRALLLIAAHGRAPLELLRRLGVGPEILDRAAAEQLVASAGGAVRFTHPLLASTVYQRAAAGEQRAAHLELAGAVDDPIGRARHLALGTSGSDDGVAADLESAAVLARSRGMAIEAAELAEHAVRLTPPGQVDDRLRRGAIAARAHLATGEASRARAIIATQLAEAPGGPRRAEALILGSELEAHGPAVALLGQALREAASAPALRAAIHVYLAGVGWLLNGRDWAERQARAALRLAERLADDRLRTRALPVLAVLRFDIADPDALDLAREAHRLALATGDPEATRDAIWAVGHQLTWLRRIDEAREWFDAALAEAAESDELLRSECLWYLAVVELWAGRWGVAREHAEQAAEIAAQYGIEYPQDHWPQALIALHRGQFAIARDHSTRAISIGEAMLPMFAAVLGIADLWSGRPDEALARLAGAEELAARRGVREPGMVVGRAEYVEALLQLGRIDDAEHFGADWEAVAIRTRRAWTLAEVIRSKGLIAAARGELDQAAELLDEAVRRHEAVGDPFGRGRALLALGGVRRRQRQKRLARRALEDALAAFDELGAATFAALARLELGQLGGRQRLEGLSPSERRVAELVAEGRKNREIAAMLFIGERTVASHLTHVYAKLGVRSRTELARRLSSEAPTIVVGPGKVPTS